MVDSPSTLPLVCITGISGYIGSLVTKYFLEDGGYRVRGTVRDPKNEAKLAPLKKAYGEELFSKIELVAADLMDAESLDKAVAGCDFVVHTASPLPTKPVASEDEVVKPAVEGTLAVMRAAHKHKVKRVVITSSGLTVMLRKPENAKAVYNEDDWSDEDVLQNYEKSKYLAERGAWDFWNSLPEGERFEFSVVIPGLVQGPTLINAEFSSANYMKMMIFGLYPFPQVAFPIVDVRDAARAHLQAIKVPEARNQRFILNEGTYRFKQLTETMKAHFGEGTYPFKTDEIAECPMDNPRAKMLQLLWNREYRLDRTRSENVLGIKYHDIKDTVIDMAESFVELGMIPDNRKK
jgi:dihydroflavonol-4-reductase